MSLVMEREKVSKKRWVCFKPIKGEPRISLDSLTISNLQMLDEHLRSFVPALFTEIKIVDNEVTVEVPHQVAQRVADHLRLNYYVNVPLEVIGV